jgi:hypothetical protein
VQRGDHLAKHVHRVGHSAAVHARVQVFVRASHFHFHVAQAAQAHRDARGVVVNDAGVGNQHHIAGEFFLVVEAEFFQVFGTHFFLAFDHKFDVARQVVGFRHHFKSLDVHEHLAFVVAGTAGENGALWVVLVFLPRVRTADCPTG